MQRIEDIGEGHSHRLDLNPVDVHIELGRAGAEAVEQADQAGLLVALSRQGIRLSLQGVEVDVAGGFHHELEAAGVAQAPHRWRPKDQYAGLQNLPPEAGAELRRDRLPAQRRISAVVEGLEDDEHEAVVRADDVQDQRLSRDGRRVGNAWRL